MVCGKALMIGLEDLQIQGGLGAENGPNRAAVVDGYRGIQIAVRNKQERRRRYEVARRTQ